MLTMDGIIVCELVLGVVMMSLIFGLFSNTDLIADSSLKSKHEPEPDSVGSTMDPGRPLTDLSPGIYGHSSRGRLGESNGDRSGSSGEGNKPRAHSSAGGSASNLV
ncbi:MAG: hypothetical protein ACREJN_08710 [Nitrospiraceae bacterium]